MSSHPYGRRVSSRVASKKRAWSRVSDSDLEAPRDERFVDAGNVVQEDANDDESMLSSLPTESETTEQSEDVATIALIDAHAPPAIYKRETGDAFPSRAWPDPVENTAILRRRWVTDAVVQRLVTELLDSPVRSRAIFPLSQIPKEATWGPKSPRTDMSGQLCWWDMPMTIRAIGYIARMSFTADTVEPIPRVVVGLELLRALDQLGLEQCIQRIGCLVPEGTIPQFEASRTAYGRHSVEPFRDAYDAPAILLWLTWSCDV
ncbi:hypothetical protein K466DRAFT_602759 [Polyporus arcularius HHB13444]|uniref:Uncharacterized protein n=1 Tax=Polyporus arcularius HHB13444 TaxID=1314778 RepID=A0A5C3P1L2_9APHY|nr:hypothetical protein K466DRAFT_602759 [Polyporus arcularius HHB13444]